jgi:demethylmenaquinone methyltransferase/2-methoxy-6-polyprenyl-1,4-benzoquinol methylase
MMDAGRKRRPPLKRVHWVHANAEKLGFSEGVFDAIFVGLGLRNLVHVERGLREMLRALKDGGRLVILEFSVPSSPIMNTLYRWYSQTIMPNFGRLVTGAKAPFEYLAESVRLFPLPGFVGDMLNKAGFADVEFTQLSRGLVTLYSAKKPLRPYSTREKS